jgi:tetratricopeptide (TPR) repeat protein
VAIKTNLAKLCKKAETLALSGQWGKESIAVNTQILEIDEHVSAAYTRLARCFLEQKNYLAAQDMYTQVLAFDPKNTIALNNLQSIKKEISKLQKLRDMAAIDSYDEVFSVGIAARRQGKLSLAVAALLRAVELKPEKPFAWNALGAAYRHYEQPKEAIDAYQKALALSYNLVSIIGLAAVERDLGNKEQSMALYKKVLDSDQNNPYALNGMGGVLSDLGLFDKAEEYFRTALKFEKGFPDAVKGIKALLRHYTARNDKESMARITRWLKELTGASPGETNLSLNGVR